MAPARSRKQGKTVLGRALGANLRRGLLLLTLGALGALGFMQGSAVGSQTSLARQALQPIGTVPRGTTPVVTQAFTVAVTVTGPGSVSSSPGGISCAGGSSCSAVFIKGTTVTLTASRSGVLDHFEGWGGPCSGTNSTCTVTAAATVTAGFGFLSSITKPILTTTTAATTFTLNVVVSGSGTVASSPSGISCGTTCMAAFASGSSVTLTATPTAGHVIASWSGGGCSGTGTTCVVSSAATVTVTFADAPTSTSTATTTTTTPTPTTTTSTGTTQPVVSNEPPAASQLPPVQVSLSIAVSGGGTVTGSAAKRGIACGSGGSSCFVLFKPGTGVTLHARPTTGFRFTGWRGGCTGSNSSCKLKVSTQATVAAVFTAQTRAAVVPVTIDQAAFLVHWQQSVGAGKLIVSGKIGKRADVDVRLSRSGGTALLTEHVSLSAGPFSLALKLEPGLLAGGAQLLPGGFVVSISGHSGSTVIPTQVKTVPLPAPVQGVVLRAFANDSQSGGAAAVVHASARAAFVHFDFQSQPSAKLPLTVAWYQPNGKLIGVANKSDRPSVVSSISSGSPLPAGTWRVDLRAGHIVVKSLDIKVK